MATVIKTNISLGDTVSVIDHPELVGVVEDVAGREALVSRDGEITVFPIYFLEKVDPKTVVVDLSKTKKETVIIQLPKTIGCCKKCNRFFSRAGHVTMEHVKKCVNSGWKVSFEADCFACGGNNN